MLKVTTTAICGSDLHVLEGRLPGMRKGGILGHEFIGIVEEAGPEVKNLMPGDRALASFLVPCGSCWFCDRAAGTASSSTSRTATCTRSRSSATA